MASALLRKSITDLSRRRSRTIFSVATLALAVASIGIFALPTLMDRATNSAVAADRLPDLTVYTRPLVLDRAELAALAGVPNVRAVEPSSFFGGRVYVGYRRAFASVRGVPDFTAQQVNVVHVASGSVPGAGAVLTDVQNANQGLLRVPAGERVRIIGADGVVRTLRVSGEGRSLAGGQSVTSDGVIVLYATSATVRSLSGIAGSDELLFRLADTRPALVSATIGAIRRVLTAIPGFRGFSQLPAVRATGDWPGKSNFQQFTKFFYVVTLLALLSALVLISNTVTTLVAEQTPEIGMMKAIGGRRRQIAAVYLKTTLLLGALGAVVGIVLGVLIANGLAHRFGSHLFAVSVGVGVSVAILLLSLVAGLVAPPLAALPPIRRAVRVPVREALQASGSAVASLDAGDRLLRRIRFLPRTAQIGLRNLGRRRRRAVSTALVIASAVGILLAVLGFANGVSNASQISWRDHGEDVKITAQGGRPLDARAASLIRATPGVTAVEPMFVTDVKLAGKDGRLWAIQQATMFRYRIATGRWYTPAEEQTRARVTVVEQDLAQATHTRVGELIGVQTASGPVSFRVIGISTNQQESGDTLFVPLTTAHAILPGIPADANDYWVRTTSHDHAFIDLTTTRIENTLTTHGYDINDEIKYVKLANEIAHNRTLVSLLAVLGLLIVAISMAGLANALTTSVLERTREIGILRSIGARAHDIRSIFATETLALATTGWLVGIPLAYGLDRLLVGVTKSALNLVVPFSFPALNIAIVLAGTILLALLITLAPIRRAAHYRPGDALRYV